MKRILCYIETLKEINVAFMALVNFGALYVAHDYVEGKNWIEDGRLYEPLTCQRCGNESIAWRQL